MSAVPATNLDLLCINTIRGLSMDAVQAANSGHPGLPLGAAPMAYALWRRHLRHNPKDPKWINRDRFVLSAGHGSMLLYSLLHLTGYDLSLGEIKNFRQFESKTPGHPENFMTPGVEMATGPLGQGFATAVGMAIAERFLAANFNRPGLPLIDHHTYVLASDGDLMEGVTNEAASLAGHLGLGKLIVLYDDNRITIDGSTDLAFTENVEIRFKGLGWHVQRIDGMDVDAVDRAIGEAKRSEQPSLIIARTVIGYGSPNKAGTSKVHGSPLGPEEVKLTKQALGIPEEPFHVPEEALKEFRKALEQGADSQAEWEELRALYAQEHPNEAATLRKALTGEWGTEWISALPDLNEKMATRQASGKTINAIAPHLPTLLGGSADLAESNLTHIKESPDFQRDTPGGRNLNFGVREHAMAAAVNGITLHGGCRAFGGTFLIFSDYCRPSLRLAALMGCPSIFVFTHDSIGLGEDGPTHQPIEHLPALRAIPNFNLMRPADGRETAACWKVALQSTGTPCALALTRQALPPVSPPIEEGRHPAERGAYVLAGDGAPQVVLVASGSEVHVALGARRPLQELGVEARVVSMPSWYLFEKQPEGYRCEVLPPGVPTLSVEAASTLGWARYAQAHVGLDSFGSSAPGEVLMKHFGFTPENVARVAQELLNTRSKA
ncbi:MAG TPA: transketolase [Fimbriimonadaceae bacterium]|nr:transketolase [Fimbriimonadaceae bacterium]